MKIEHIAIWVNDLGEMRAFYERYFQAKAGDLYTNPVKMFSSYFFNFKGGSRLELMHNPEFPKSGKHRISNLAMLILLFL